MEVFQHGLGSRVHPQFFEQVLEMAMNRPGADAQRLGDLLVLAAFGQAV